jgi:hypothetical protein
MTCTSTKSLRRRRIVAAALSLPLALGMTGTAFAAGTGDALAGAPAELRAAAGASAGSSADRAIAEKAAATTAGTGSAAGAASGKSAATSTSTGGTYVNGNTNSSKDERPTALVPGTPSQPLSKADKNGTGANPGTTCTHAYCSNGTGLEPGNGNDSAPAKGQPCAGCVGKADNKNPKGQYPSGPVDHNAGYECDRNQGIGKANPAHTGCTGTTPAPTSKPSPKPSTTPKNETCPGGKPMPASGNKKDCDNGGGGGGGNDTCPGGKPMPPSGNKKDCDNGGGNGGGGTITICHATGSATNPYVELTINKNGLNGHGGHGGDIIPMPASGCPGGNGGGGGGDDKITICHATGSSSNPYVQLTINKNGLNGHGGHAGDIIPMPASGCPGGSTPTPTPTSTSIFDACPNVPGHQPAGTTCPTPVPPVLLCPNGQVMPNGNPVNCPTAPPVCPTSPTMGPVMAGCAPVVPPVGTGGGGGVIPPVVVPVGNPPVVVPPVGPPTGIKPPVKVKPNSAVGPAVVTLPAARPASRPASRPAAARPSALPFTGTDAALLVELGALLLLAGGGVVVASRRRTVRVG